MPHRPPPDRAHDLLVSRVFALAEAAAARGNEPFAALLALDGSILLEAMNTVATTNDRLAHAEMNLLRLARRELAWELWARSTLYTSTEPCMLCAGEIVRTPIRRIVYGCAAHPSVSGGDVLRAATPPIRITGPLRNAPPGEPHCVE